MTVLLIIIAILVLLITLPIRLRLRLDGRGFRAYVGVWFLYKQVYPPKPRKAKPKRRKKPKPKPEPPPEPKKEKKPFQMPAWDVIKQWAGLIRKALLRLGKQIRILRLQCDVIYGTGSPYSTGTLYPVLSGSCVLLLDWMQKYLRIRRKPRVRLTADYVHATVRGTADVIIAVRPFVLVFSVAQPFFPLLKQQLFKKSRSSS